MSFLRLNYFLVKEKFWAWFGPIVEYIKKLEGKVVKLGKNKEMVLQKAGLFAKSLSDVLVCPLSKHPLRYCEISNSLISDAIGVSFPIKNGIPCLVPRDGKILDEEDVAKPDSDANSSAVSEENGGRSF